LFDYVADGVLSYGVRFDDGKSPLQRLHKFSRQSFALRC
jgi:hypothetical protein